MKKQNRLLSAIAFPVLIAALVWLQTASTVGATIHVSNNSDGPPPGPAGSLRAAVNTANSNADAANTIVFDPNVIGTITLSSVQLGITKDLTILGPTSIRLIIAGGPIGRIFSTVNFPGIQVIITDLTIFQTYMQGDGAAIYNSATMSLTNVVINNCYSATKNGGGIYNSGSLALVQCAMSNNISHLSGGAIMNEGGAANLLASGCIFSGNYSQGLATGGGGAIFNSGGNLTINASTFYQNYARAITASGSGGAILNEGNLTVEGSIFRENGADGLAGADGDFGQAGINGDRAVGGAISATRGVFTNCLFESCYARGGRGGVGGSGTSGGVAAAGGEGGRALGGAIHMNPLGGNGVLHIYSCSFSSNSAFGGAGGAGGHNSTGGAGGGGAGGKGGDAEGGALVIEYLGTGLTVVNCTFGWNSAKGGDGGVGGDGFLGGGGGNGGGGGSTDGGAIFMAVGCDAGGCKGLADSTICLNFSQPGPGGSGGGGSTPGLAGGQGQGRGGGLAGQTVPVLNTILAANNFSGTGAGPDVYGAFGSLGHNLIGKADGSSGWLAGDLQGTIGAPLDPQLGPLQDNGGPTPTMALAPCSPAVDAGTPDQGIDQRGEPRPFGNAPDIGAYELQGPITAFCLNLNNTSCHGVVIMTPNQTSYAPNSIVTLRAVPAVGWAFANWSGDASGAMNPLTVTLTTNQSISANFSPLSAACVCSPSGLVSWWPAGNNANDIAGGHNGTLMNGALFATGKAGKAFNFDGVDDYVSVPHSTAFDINSAITVEAWIKTSSGVNRYIITKNDDSFYLAIGPDGTTANKLSFWLNGVSTGWLQGTTDLNDNQWHHVAGTYDGSTLKVYVDGQLQNSIARSGNIQTGSNPVLIGARPFGINFAGLIDEVAIYNRALSATEILTISTAGSVGRCLTPVYITSVSKSGNHVNLTWSSQPGLSYRVEYKTDLGAASWTDVSGDVTATGASASKTDVLPANEPQRFYRVEMFR